VNQDVGAEGSPKPGVGELDRPLQVVPGVATREVGDGQHAGKGLDLEADLVVGGAVKASDDSAGDVVIGGLIDQECVRMWRDQGALTVPGSGIVGLAPRRFAKDLLHRLDQLRALLPAFR